MQGTNLPRRNRVFKSLHKPLTYLGIERTVFYFVCVGAVGVFNLFESLLAGVVVFIGGFIFGRWLTNADPAMLRILAQSERFRTRKVGDVKKYPTESAAHAAADALRLTINNRCDHRNLRRTIINTLWEHYSQEELPLKALSTQDAYIIYAKNWIVPRWGNLPLEQVKTVEVELATSDRGGGWDQSQDQVRDVGFVFARRSVGVLWPQSHLFRHTGGNWGQARPEHRCADQRQASEIPSGLVTRTGQAGSGRIGVSRSASRVSGRSLGTSSRRTRGAPLARVRLREHELQRSTLVLLASRWESEVHKNGSVCKATADASKPEILLAGVEVAKPLQQTGRFRVPFGKTARKQAVRSSFSVKEEDSACIQTDRNHGCGLAHVSTFGRNHAGGDGRTSAHNPRLLAAQQPSCHEQVPAGDIEDQTFGTGQIGRRYFADRYFAEDKPNPMSAVWERSRVGAFSGGTILVRRLSSPNIP
jgi:type IV secretory pathway TrbD component